MKFINNVLKCTLTKSLAEKISIKYGLSKEGWKVALKFLSIG